MQPYVIDEMNGTRAFLSWGVTSARQASQASSLTQDCTESHETLCVLHCEIWYQSRLTWAKNELVNERRTVTCFLECPGMDNDSSMKLQNCMDSRECKTSYEAQDLRNFSCFEFAIGYLDDRVFHTQWLTPQVRGFHLENVLSMMLIWLTSAWFTF